MALKGKLNIKQTITYNTNTVDPRYLDLAYIEVKFWSLF